MQTEKLTVVRSLALRVERAETARSPCPGISSMSSSRQEIVAAALADDSCRNTADVTVCADRSILAAHIEGEVQKRQAFAATVPTIVPMKAVDEVLGAVVLRQSVAELTTSGMLGAGFTA